MSDPYPDKQSDPIRSVMKQIPEWLNGMSDAIAKADLRHSSNLDASINVEPQEQTEIVATRRRRKRKGDIYVERTCRWFVGQYAEEAEGDLLERAAKWRKKGWTEKEIVRQLRWEFAFIAVASAWRLFRGIFTIVFNVLVGRLK